MKYLTPLIGLASLASALVGCSKHSSEAAAVHLGDTDFVSLTNAMIAKTGEPVFSVDRLTGDNTNYFLVVTGSTSDPHHYYVRWYRSRWSINRIVK
jgi:hypothetical protein